eukprot:TRINITY_DN956_c0_g1_i12.p1 TRINITY_DN956_c0_g1~~TRINITY_DN956_c0_g1_i12.p1  ORF type:complete len:473 (-),score=177.01 TRINITY_DN956_c0_g1_i12:211-1560(-)
MIPQSLHEFACSPRCAVGQVTTHGAMGHEQQASQSSQPQPTMTMTMRHPPNNTTIDALLNIKRNEHATASSESSSSSSSLEGLKQEQIANQTQRQRMLMLQTQRQHTILLQKSINNPTLGKIPHELKSDDVYAAGVGAGVDVEKEDKVEFPQQDQIPKIVKPFSCPHCGYSCSQKQNMESHIRTHTKEKPFECPFCSYRTCDQSGLYKHVRVHTGEKPFSCPFCNYRASLKAHVTSHIRTHTKEKPFICPLCDYAASHKAAVKKHFTRKHQSFGDSVPLVMSHAPSLPLPSPSFNCKSSTPSSSSSNSNFEISSSSFSSSTLDAQSSSSSSMPIQCSFPLPSLSSLSSFSNSSPHFSSRESAPLTHNTTSLYGEVHSSQQNKSQYSPASASQDLFLMTSPSTSLSTSTPPPIEFDSISNISTSNCSNFDLFPSTFVHSGRVILPPPATQ